jgi:hypothetical protein
MFNFNGISHIDENTYAGRPEGFNFSLCGSVPTCLMEHVPANQSDVMGGRAHREAGKLMTWKKRYWPTVEAVIDAVQDAIANGNDVHLCTSARCACRRVLWPHLAA